MGGLPLYKNKQEGKKIDTRAFEVSDTVSQLPPVRENFPDPIRRRISSGVSFGPLANGVYLKQEKMGSTCFYKNTL